MKKSMEFKYFNDAIFKIMKTYGHHVKGLECSGQV